jgi:hypothetical protein
MQHNDRMTLKRAGLIGTMIVPAMAVWLWPMWLDSAQPAVADSPDFHSTIRSYSQVLASLASDEEALGLFSSTLGPALDLHDVVAVVTAKPGARSSRQSGKSSSDSATTPDVIARDVRDAAVRLAAGLAAWRIASALKETADSGDQTAARTELEQAAKQKGWLKGKGTMPFLGRVLELGGSLIAIPDVQADQTEDAPGYAPYASYLDRTYPRLAGSDDSWLALAEQEGSIGLHRRLAEYWKSQGTAGPNEVFISRYFNSRLRPALSAHMLAHALRMEADAERQTREAWRQLRTWRDRMKELKGLARLCGTWQWTVHNHQNHQEHKMILVFPPPSADGGSNSAGPAKVAVLGDAVYLRWESPGGVQEDSLLFAGEGRRLEGTFVNSAGAWGSITGKRAQPCPKNNAEQ